MNGNTDLTGIVEWVTGLGPPSLFVLFIIGLVRSWWYTASHVDTIRAQLEAERREKEWWRDVAVRALKIGEQAVSDKGM